MIESYYKSPNNDFLLAQGDSFKLLEQFNFKFDMIFADPPYFLSNGGISLQNGKVVCVDKGDWDKGKTPDEINAFNMKWLKLCREKLKDNGTIWISGTYHNIFSVANCLTTLGYKILNVVTWQKTNPPVNISCRFFTYSTEFIIWARKYEKVPHKFNYELMKRLNGDKQMTDVWRLPAIGRWEKSCGKHPTQKPLSVLTRIILASTDERAWILDPFCGSSTTGIAANLCGRRFCGIDQAEEFCEMSKSRREEIENPICRTDLKKHINDLKILELDNQMCLFTNEPEHYDILPFDTPPLNIHHTDYKKSFLTCYVRKDSPECKFFMNHEAKMFKMKLKHKKMLTNSNYLFPMVKGDVDGYYEIKNYIIDGNKVIFYLGKYTQIKDQWTHIYHKMKSWELLSLDECIKLCE